MFINQSVVSIQELKTYQSGQILPVFTFHELLSSGSQRKLIAAIKQLLNVPEQYYAMLYEPLIHHFAEYVQLIPTEKEVHLGSLLYEGLLNAYYILELYQENYGAAQDNRITYALFSAALLNNVHKVVKNQQIIMTDEEGSFQISWVMTEKSMLNQGEFYSLIFYNSKTSQQYFDSVKLVIARQLMGETGFSWIAAEQNVFFDWLSALFGNHDDDLDGFFSNHDEFIKKITYGQRYC